MMAEVLRLAKPVGNTLEVVEFTSTLRKLDRLESTSKLDGDCVDIKAARLQFSPPGL